MPNITLQDLLHRASEAITRDEKWIYKASYSKNKRSREFLCDVADHLIATTVKWSHLQSALNVYREGK